MKRDFAAEVAMQAVGIDQWPRVVYREWWHNSCAMRYKWHCSGISARRMSLFRGACGGLSPEQFENQNLA
ncbi:hypothetical protein GCM10023078_08350 [Gibbsiella greigii]